MPESGIKRPTLIVTEYVFTLLLMTLKFRFLQYIRNTSERVYQFSLFSSKHKPFFMKYFDSYTYLYTQLFREKFSFSWIKEKENCIVTAKKD